MDPRKLQGAFDSFAGGTSPPTREQMKDAGQLGANQINHDAGCREHSSGIIERDLERLCARINYLQWLRKAMQDSPPEPAVESEIWRALTNDRGRY